MTLPRKLLDMACVTRLEPFIWIDPDVETAPDSIIAPAFGQRENPDDDVINIQLAEAVRTELFDSLLPIVAQKEIATHLKKRNFLGQDVVVHAINQHRIRGKYLDTWEVLIQGYELGYRRPIIVAHPDHVWRLVRTAERIGFTITGIANTTHISYDPQSSQRWTKSRWRFVLYDRLVARPGYLATGKI